MQEQVMESHKLVMDNCFSTSGFLRWNKVCGWRHLCILSYYSFPTGQKSSNWWVLISLPPTAVHYTQVNRPCSSSARDQSQVFDQWERSHMLTVRGLICVLKTHVDWIILVGKLAITDYLGCYISQHRKQMFLMTNNIIKVKLQYRLHNLTAGCYISYPALCSLV